MRCLQPKNLLLKSLLLKGSVAFVTLTQSIAMAQMTDLPDPGVDSSAPTSPSVPSNSPSPTSVQTQYAGTLRLTGISRKSGGTVYRLDLAQGQHLLRIDMRVLAQKVKIHSAQAVTTSDQRLALRQLMAQDLVESGTALSSENISLNENVTAIELSLESFGGEAEVIVTALASTGVPRLSLRQEVKPQTPVVSVPENHVPDNRASDNGSVIYYGNVFNEYDRVLYLSREVATISYVYDESNYEITLERTGSAINVTRKDLSRSLECVAGFCQNQQVEYSGYVAKIGDLFENRFASIEVDYGTYSENLVVPTRSLKKISRVQPTKPRVLSCTNDRIFCLGDQVQYDGYIVTIRAIYVDGTALVVDAAGVQKVFIQDLYPVSRRRR